MDRSELKKALKLARNIVMTHGITNHMTEHYKESLLRYDESEYHDHNQYEFLLDPKRSGWSNGNFVCCLNVGYESGENVLVAGGFYRDYFRRISIRYGNSEFSLEQVKERENFINSLLMVAEMIESCIPQKITLTVETPEEVTNRKRKEHEQNVGFQIYHELGSSSFKNLRTGGKGRICRIPDSYLNVHENMPEAGTYRYTHIDKRDRRGRPTSHSRYVFDVSLAFNGDSYVKIFKVD
ncbi:MAG: hypothetical protein EBU90_17390 [Proteobacteria bacterium]|nr:hypothetical protein [Pseudomonadota bacterium]